MVLSADARNSTVNDSGLLLRQPNRPSTMEEMVGKWDGGMCSQVWGVYTGAQHRLHPTETTASAARFTDPAALDDESDLLTEEGVLGEGTFGKVVKVKEQTTGKYFALKTALPGGQVGQVTEMVVHLRFLKAGGHPNLLQVYAMNDRNGLKPILSELAKCDLGKIVFEHEPVTMADKIQILLGVARGLKFAHGMSNKDGCMAIVHNDIKAGNIMMFADNTPKIGDWGVAATLFDRRQGQGTLGSLPPEVLYDNDILCRCCQDVYSFGALVMVVLLKPELRSHNLWLRETFLRPEDVEHMDGLTNEGEKAAYRKEVSYSSQTGATYHKLLKPENFPDDLPDASLVCDGLRHIIDPNPEARPQTMKLPIGLLKGMAARVARPVPQEHEPPAVAISATAATFQPAPDIAEPTPAVPRPLSGDRESNLTTGMRGDTQPAAVKTEEIKPTPETTEADTPVPKAEPVQPGRHFLTRIFKSVVLFAAKGARFLRRTSRLLSSVGRTCKRWFGFLFG